MLPIDAVPDNDITQLRKLTLSEWIEKVEDKFICNSHNSKCEF